MEELWYQVKRLLSNFTHFQKRSRLKRYTLPLILVVIVFLLKHYFHTLLYGDRYRIGQVITNLLTNALKYSPEDTNVIVKLKETGKQIILSVKDKGLGISTGDQKKVFSRFYRTQKVQGNKSQGLGLGLFICTQIVNHHKGRLYFKSREGKGTTFFLELPLGV